MRFPVLALLLVSSCSFSTIFAQNEAEQLTNFPGNVDTFSLALDFFSPDDEHIVTINSSSPLERGYSLLSEIDLATGEIVPLLPPDEAVAYAFDWHYDSPFQQIGDKKFVVLYTHDHGPQLYRMGDEGTVRLTNARGGIISPLVEMDGEVYFLLAAASSSSPQGSHGAVWKTDGTVEGTQAVIPYFPGTFNRGSYVHNLVAAEGNLFLSTFSGYSAGPQYRIIDLDTESTQTLVPRYPARGITPMQVHAGGFYFVGQDDNINDGRSALMRINANDPTMVPVVVIADFDTNEEEEADVFSLRTHNGNLFFSAQHRSYSDSHIKTYRITEENPSVAALLYNGSSGPVMDLEFSEDSLFLIRETADFTAYELASLNLNTLELNTLFQLPNGSYGIDEIQFQRSNEAIYLINKTRRKIDRYRFWDNDVFTFSNLGDDNISGAPMSLLINDNLYFRQANSIVDDEVIGETVGESIVRINATLSTPIFVAALNQTITRGVKEILTDQFTGTKLPMESQVPGDIFNIALYDQSTESLTYPEHSIDAVISDYDQFRVENEVIYRGLLDDFFNYSSYLFRLNENTLEQLHIIDILGDTLNVRRNVYRAGADSYIRHNNQLLRLGLPEAGSNNLELTPVIAYFNPPNVSVAQNLEHLTIKVSSTTGGEDSIYVYHLPDLELAYRIADLPNTRLLSTNVIGAFFYRGGTTPRTIFIDANGNSTEQILPMSTVIGGQGLFPFQLDDRLLVAGQESESGREFFLIDPSAGTTELLKDINPGRGNSLFHSGIPIDTLYYFSANDGESGYELWRSDLTSAGTYRVADIRAGSGYGNPENFKIISDFLVFSATGPNGNEIYRMSLDGSETVQLVADVNPGDDGSYPRDFVETVEGLYFRAIPTTGAGYQLFRLPIELVPTKDELLAEVMPTVFPNPTADILKILAPEDKFLTHYELYTTDGRQVQHKNLNNVAATQIDLSYLPAGNYWLLSRYETGESSRQLVQKF